MKEFLKRILPASARRRARRLGRIRWLTKIGVVRRYGASPLREWRYVLLDPEVDSFTYPIANQDELARTLASVLNRSPEELARIVGETRTDPMLRDAMRQPLKHILWSKRQPEPRAYHQACWAIVRALRPACAVETGILDGMASTVILAAFARNASEGSPGELLSFDTMPGAGAMVPADLRTHWQPVYEDAVASLDAVIGDRRIGFLTSDSLPDVTQISAELDAALRHRAETFVALTTWGSLGDLGWPGPRPTVFDEQPVGHFYHGSTFAVSSL